MPEPDPAALAASLAETARNLEQYIEERAREIAAPQIAAAEQEYHARATQLRREHKAQMQRWQDLNTELRRQLRARERQVEQQAARIAELKSADEVIRRIEKTPLRVDEERHLRYLTSADLMRALYDGDPQRAADAVARSLPAMLTGLRDKLRVDAGQDAT